MCAEQVRFCGAKRTLVVVAKLSSRSSDLEPAADPLPENPDYLLAGQVPEAMFLLLDQRNGVVSAEVVGNTASNVELLNHPHLPRVKHKPDLLRRDPDVRFRHSADDPRAAPK